ncbi:PxKF domain-containing protein [Deinococcus navajonensis]|uniref:PxKF domain-containing protein n=1 Tax=Deinococcus navajonensis TaxID=309884 RepID=A0ABV8XN12_9DEIO
MIYTKLCATPNAAPIINGPKGEPAGSAITHTATAAKTLYTFNLTVSDEDKGLVPTCVISTGMPDDYRLVPVAAGSFSGSASLPLGTSTFTCTTKDSSNLEGKFSWMVNVVDQTKPTITAAVVSGKLGSNGWYVFDTATNTGDVTVRFTCADQETNLAEGACPADEVVSADTALEGRIIAKTVTDVAGNVSTATNLVIKRDTIAPTISGVADAAPNANGWYNGDVAVTFTCSDSGSGVTGCPITATVQGEGNNLSIARSITDAAGNSASSTISGIKIDRTVPNAALAFNGTAGVEGWYRGLVKVSTTGTDALSDIASCTAEQSFTDETNGTAVSGTCTDKAGNTSNAATGTVKIDNTAPVTELKFDGIAGMEGWYRGLVKVSTKGTDALSQVASCTDEQSFSNETDGTAVSGTCTDKAGNTSNAATGTVKIDNTAPNAALTFNGTAGVEGWYRGLVKVSTTGTDALSDIASCTAEQSFTDETNGTAVSGTCTDKAGNTSDDATGTVKIDNTAPIITGKAVKDPNENGWYNGAVAVTFTCTDALSGINGTCPAGTVSGEGSNLGVTKSIQDKAGNEASASVTGIKIDTTAPTITASRTPAANAQGWNNTSVNVTFTCNDALSGTATCTAPVELGQGAGQSATGTVTDQAGNEATVTVKDINVDLAKPTIDSKLSAAANAAGWFKESVTATFTCADTLSGILNCTAPYTFNEGDNLSTTGTATDRAENTTTVAVNGIKVDLTNPSFTAPFTTLFATSTAGATLEAASLKPTDILSGVASATCRLTGSTAETSALALPIGVSAVTCTVTDNAGRTGTLSGNVTVTFSAIGTDGKTYNLLAPLKNTPADLSLVKLGSTVPLKFLAPSFVGGTPATDLASGLKLFVSYRSNTVINDPSYEVTEVVTGSSIWRYDNGQYIFNLSTKSGYKAGTYDVEVRYNGILIAKSAFNVKP